MHIICKGNVINLVTSSWSFIKIALIINKYTLTLIDSLIGQELPFRSTMLDVK